MLCSPREGFSRGICGEFRSGNRRLRPSGWNVRRRGSRPSWPSPEGTGHGTVTCFPRRRPGSPVPCPLPTGPTSGTASTTPTAMSRGWTPWNRSTGCFPPTPTAWPEPRPWPGWLWSGLWKMPTFIRPPRSSWILWKGSPPSSIGWRAMRGRPLTGGLRCCPALTISSTSSMILIWRTAISPDTNWSFFRM